MRILFVDDDVIARRSIESKLDWSKFGWELVYNAKNGMDALDYIKNNPLELVLSDIKMPVMNGIQMAEIAKEYNPDLKFIFLSGYKDFTYAKQALQLNAIDYLEKPIQQKELVDVLFKAENLIQQKQKINRVVHKEYPIIKRHFFSQLMHEEFRTLEEESLRAFDVSLEDGFGVVAFISFSSEVAKQDKKTVEALCQTLETIWQGSVFLPMERGEIFLLFPVSHVERKAEFQEKLQELEHEVRLFSLETWQEEPLFRYGSIFQELSQMRYSYQEALQERNSHISQLLLEIKRFIETNYSNPELSLNRIADHFNINNCYLTSVFKDTFGINLYDYIIQVRMEQAESLLRKTDLKSYQIAEQIGYNNAQYFSISFKKHFGDTATAYRNKHRITV